VGVTGVVARCSVLLWCAFTQQCMHHVFLQMRTRIHYSQWLALLWMSRCLHISDTPSTLASVGPPSCRLHWRALTLLSDAFEAIFGAVFLDSDGHWPTVWRVLSSLMRLPELI